MKKFLSSWTVAYWCHHASVFLRN